MADIEPIWWWRDAPGSYDRMQFTPSRHGLLVSMESTNGSVTTRIEVRMPLDQVDQRIDVSAEWRDQRAED